jgi:hypothetical protein
MHERKDEFNDGGGLRRACASNKPLLSLALSSVGRPRLLPDFEVAGKAKLEVTIGFRLAEVLRRSPRRPKDLFSGHRR